MWNRKLKRKLLKSGSCGWKSGKFVITDEEVTKEAPELTFEEYDENIKDI